MKINRSVYYLIGLVIMIALWSIANYHGLGYTYDSHLYIKIAHQIGTDGFLNTQGFNLKPPLYPLMLSLNGIDYIPLFNLVCLMISYSVLFFAGLEIKSKLLWHFYMGLLIFSTPLYLVHSFAWTEPLFISVLLLTFLLLNQYYKSDRKQFLCWALMLLFLLPFIRFAGIFILLPLIAVLFVDKKIHAKSLAIVVVGVLFLIFWAFYFHEGFIQRWQTFLTPIKTDAFRYYSYNLSSYLEAISLWFVPLPVLWIIRILVSIIFICVIAVVSVNFLRRENLKRSHIYHSIPIIFLFYYLTLHFVFTVESYSAERYLAPFYNLLILAGFILTHKYYDGLNKLKKTLLICGIVFLLVYSSVRTIKNVIFWYQIRSEITLHNP